MIYIHDGKANTLAPNDRAVPILVSVPVSGQYQKYVIVLESVKYVIQVPNLLFVHYNP